MSAQARVLLLGIAATLLLVAMLKTGTGDDPYAPNDWLFSHAWLAERALETGELPLNRNLLQENSFGETADDFQQAVGLHRMTFYANTMWHFWNGLPLQPGLLAGVSALTGLEPEDAARVPLGAIVVLLLTFAAADLLLARQPHPVSWTAPFAVALLSAPLALDLRVLMPSTTLVIVCLLLILLLRRALVHDRRALAFCIPPLALLPFWYYTVSYFVILLFLAFLAGNVILRLRRAPTQPLVPLLVATLVPIGLAAVLFLNGALTSHLNMASTLGSNPFLGGEASADYDEHLNRQPWRSALLYLQLGILFLPLAALGLHAAWRIAQARAADPAGALFAQWAAGGALFSGFMLNTVGPSFLNRTAIYLTPLAAIAFAYACALAWRRPIARRAAVATLLVGALVTPALVASAAPAYAEGDRQAFTWMETHVPPGAVVYGSLDASSVLFREHGFTEAIAFHPRESLLEEFWYSHDPNTTVVYLASVEWFVLRDDARTHGFEEFGPLRQPLDDAAYQKFGKSPDLRRVFDNGEVEIFQVQLSPERYGRAPR